MRRFPKLLFSAISICLLAPAVAGGTFQATDPAQDVITPRRVLAVTYPEDTTVKVKFGGTMRLPGASGEAKVKRKPGAAEIEIELDEMKPAFLFGGDYNTYVLWMVSPEGATVNAGEFVLRGNRGELNVSTPLTAFGMMITAEPHFLASAPSPFVVLVNTNTGLASGKGVTAAIVDYEGFPGAYRFERDSLADVPATRGESRVDRYQAAVAVDLAERAGARQYAPVEFSTAQEALTETITGFADGLDEKQLGLIARRTVRLAVEARRLAEERAAKAALEAERKALQEQIEQLKQAKAEADAAMAHAREEARRAQQERQEALQARAEAEAAAEKAHLEQRQARDIMLRARQEADSSAQLQLQAQDEAALVRRQAAETRARMQDALSRVADTQETARGVVVNLPDILFDTGKSTLQPRAREVLSRIAGVLLVVSHFRLNIEGHTDSVGSGRSNQELSEKRAQSVREYLVDAQLPPEWMATAGFGESRPLASNRTTAGRQQNRRVEIVIFDVR